MRLITGVHGPKPFRKSRHFCARSLTWTPNRQKRLKQSSRPPTNGCARLTSKKFLDYQHFSCQCRLSAASIRRSSTTLTISGMTSCVISCLKSASAFGSIGVRPSIRSNTFLSSALSFCLSLLICLAPYWKNVMLSSCTEPRISLCLGGSQILGHASESCMSHVGNLQSTHTSL